MESSLWEGLVPSAVGQGMGSTTGHDLQVPRSTQEVQVETCRDMTFGLSLGQKGLT